MNWIATADRKPDSEMRVLGWCVYPAGEECRLCRFDGKHFWAHGLTQNVTHWMTLPGSPTLTSAQ